MTVDELLQSIRKSRLLSEKHQAFVRETARTWDANEPLTPESLSNRLVKERLLTEWQAKMLLQNQTGFVLGQYKLLTPIGRGGMGQVFKARDRKKKRVVAIKVLSKKLAKNKKLVARFQREIELATKLDSPYIVRTVDAGVIGQSHFMVMEYVDGESIDEIAIRHGRVKAEHACELARQAALGLQAAFEQGMVHRDIKPANLMVSFADDGLAVKLLDMGLARLDEQENDGMTRTGQVMGTPDYMAPEQGWNTADVDIRADIYSLGCSLFRLVTGTVPFPGDNPLQILMARCSVDAPLASSIVPDLDPRIDAVIRRMTWRDPGKRFQKPIEVAEALAGLSVAPTADELAAGTGTASPATQPTLVQGATAPAEPTFKEFLRDMDSGAEVTLLDGSTHSEGFGRPANDMPVGGGGQVQRKSSRTVMLGGGLTIAAAGAIGFAVFSGLGDEPKPKDKIGKGTAVVAPPPKVNYFAEIPAQRVEPGQVVSFFATPEIVTGLEGIEYSLGTGAPDGATLDAETGEFFWLLPGSQASGRLTLQLLATRDGKVEAERDVFIDVKATRLMAKIVEFENQPAMVGQVWTYSLQLFGQKVGDVPTEFKLVGNPPDGLTLDATTGVLTWTPKVSQVGRQPLSIQLIDPKDDRVIHTATCSVLVGIDGRPSVRLPDKSIEAGKPFTINLTEEAGIRQRAVWTLVSPQVGATVTRRSGLFRWTPPAETRGRTAFQFSVIGARQTGEVILTLNVTAPSEPTTTETSGSPLPSEAEITDAEAKVREIFERDFAQRSTNAKRELASKLLLRSFDENTPAMHCALLRLGFDVAKDCKAYATGTEIAQLLAARFRGDSVALTLSLVDGFRSRGVSLVDKAVLGEVIFREALAATESDRFQSAASLIKVASSIARTGNYSDVTKEATSRLRALPTDSDEPGEISDEQRLAKDELSALLRKYQFTEVFRGPDNMRFLKNDVGEPGTERALWEFNGSRISLESPQSEMVTGFVDPAISSATFVLRMQVASDSTTGQLLLGSPNTGRIFGYQVPLAGKDLLHVKQSNLRESLARPKGRVSHDKSGWDLIEVSVSNDKVLVALNGNPVTEAQLPEPPLGSAGLIAVLNSSAGEQKLRVRNVRIMRTTTDAE